MEPCVHAQPARKAGVHSQLQGDGGYVLAVGRHDEKHCGEESVHHAVPSCDGGRENLCSNFSQDDRRSDRSARR